MLEEKEEELLDSPNSLDHRWKIELVRIVGEELQARSQGRRVTGDKTDHHRGLPSVSAETETHVWCSRRLCGSC